MFRTKSILASIIFVGLLPLSIESQAESFVPGPQAGTIVEQQRVLKSIPNAIEVHGPINLDLTQGDAARFATIAEENLQSKLSIKFDGERLRIELDDEMSSPRDKIILKLVLPELKKIAVRGSGSARVTGFLGNKVEIGRHGSGDLEFLGQYANVSVETSGSGELELSAGRSESMEIHSSGSGTVTVTGTVVNLLAGLRGSGQLSASKLVASTVRLNTRGSSLAHIRAERELNLDTRGPGRVIVAGNPTVRNETSRNNATVIWE